MQDVLSRTLESAIEAKADELIAEKLQAAGASLSESQRKGLFRELVENEGKICRDGPDDTFAIELTDEDLKGLEHHLHSLEQAIPRIIETVTEECAHTMLVSLKRRWGRESRRQERERKAFRAALSETWGEPLSLLELLLTVCLETGSEISGTAEASLRSTPHLFEVLRRSHARACQVSAEILLLLRNGLADGAMARWRTLHEITVTASFIAEHGEELAQRFMEYSAIESKRSADEYARCAPRLGYEPLDAVTVSDIQRQYESLVAKYGKDYAEPYGWAGHHLAKKRPKFSMIEDAVEDDHLRSHYKLASQGVHANPKGMFYSLGMLNEGDSILAGPSDFGLFEPAQNLARSLLVVTAVLVKASPSLEGTIEVRVATALVDDIMGALSAAHERLTASRSAGTED